MNKHCFRVIFNKVLQRLVVVSELDKTEGKGGRERGDKRAFFAKNLSQNA